jgi:hypothetical protein
MDALNEADAILIRAFDEARGKVSNLPAGDKIGGRCLRCSCEYLIPHNRDVIPGADAPYLGCMGLGSRHLLTSHVLPGPGPLAVIAFRLLLSHVVARNGGERWLSCSKKTPRGCVDCRRKFVVDFSSWR